MSTCAANCIPLLIQQSVDGTYSFNRSWAEFKVGFNDSRGNYWLGNDLLHQLTNGARYKLQCVLQRTSRVFYVANYNIFLVGSESSNYTLSVGRYRGGAVGPGDAMAIHDGMMFSTYDRDNDLSSGNCAQQHGGGFWHNNCYSAGMTVMKDQGDGFVWKTLSYGTLQRATLLLTC